MNAFFVVYICPLSFLCCLLVLLYVLLVHRILLSRCVIKCYNVYVKDALDILAFYAWCILPQFSQARLRLNHSPNHDKTLN